MTILLTIIIFIFILGILVFVHELGHFIAARRAGMKVDEFGFGFPPRLFGFKRGETLYSINAIPLGGFVKIVGEEGASSDPRAFANASFGHRLLTLLAGVIMNFILGWVLLFLAFFIVGAPIDVQTASSLPNAKLHSDQIRVTGVLPDSSAEHAGFKPGDVIVSIDGQRFETLENIINYNKSRLGQNVTFELKRGGQTVFRDVTPDASKTEAPVGFGLERIARVTFPILESIRYASLSFAQTALVIFQALGLLFQKLFSSGQLAEGLAGPIGIAAMTKDFINSGPIYLLHFVAVLSINLGVLNAFPFPALDGGRVLFLLVEKIRGAKSLKIERTANIVGFLLLMLLMVAVTFKDVGRFSDEFKRLFERIF